MSASPAPTRGIPIRSRASASTVPGGCRRIASITVALVTPTDSRASMSDNFRTPGPTPHGTAEAASRSRGVLGVPVAIVQPPPIELRPLRAPLGGVLPFLLAAERRAVGDAPGGADRLHAAPV